MTDPHSGLKEVVDSAKWTEGDFSLVSADGVRFRVPSRALFVARYVARHPTLTGSDVLATAGQSVGWDLLEWDFADPQLESAAVLDRFLELVVNGSLIRLSDHDPVDLGLCERYLHLLNFLKKYKCTLALRLFELCATSTSFKAVCRVEPYLCWVQRWTTPVCALPRSSAFAPMTSRNAFTARFMSYAVLIRAWSVMSFGSISPLAMQGHGWLPGQKARVCKITTPTGRTPWEALYCISSID
jgi:hypothetical protein